jgi:hypothetical protein
MYGATDPMGNGQRSDQAQIERGQTSSKRRAREVSPELKEFMHMLKTIEDQAEANGLPEEE